VNQPITVAGVEVAPGERRDVMPVASESYTGDRTTIPMAVLNGAGDGPRVFVTAAIHGDELNGIGVCRQLLSRLEPSRLDGILVIVPIVNVLGAQIHSRYLPDRRDLNRTFPGSYGGSMASRIAKLLMEEVVKASDVGIDLHTAANRRTNVPQVRVHRGDERAHELGLAFGAPYLLDAALRAGSLREVAGELGVPVLTYEGGEALRFDDAAIEVASNGVLRVLGHLGMIPDPPPAPAEPPLVMHQSRWVRAERGGIIDLHVTMGQQVAEGEPLWTTTSPLGAERATIGSPYAGIIIGGTTLPLVSPGEAVLHVGVPGDGWLGEDDPSLEEDDVEGADPDIDPDDAPAPAS
jgi:predicted deacylase